MSVAGTHWIGDTPRFIVGDDFLPVSGTSTIRRYSAMSFETGNSGKIEPTIYLQSGSRDRFVGFALLSFPDDPAVYDLSNATRRDSIVWDGNIQNKLGVRKKKAGWMLVFIPTGGDDVTINLTASYASADIILDILEERRVVGKAWSRIHAYDLPTTHADYDAGVTNVGSGPSLGLNELSSGTAFTASTTAVRIGYVFGEMWR
jgi:hypothetical protein